MAGELTRFFETHEWCQNTYVQDKDGNPVKFDNPNKHAFCILGGIREVMGTFECELRDKLYEAQAKKYPDYVGIAYLNDSEFKSKEEVLEFLREFNL